MVEVLVAIIGALGLVLVALIGVVLPNLIMVKRQVKNGHGTNLREENDERHSQNVASIEEVKRLIRAQSRSMGRRFHRIEQRLGVVEDTIPANRRKQP